MSFLLSFIPEWLQYALAIGVALIVIIAINALTHSLKLTAFIIASLVMVGGTFGYADALVRRGEEQCAAKVEAASAALKTYADDLKQEYDKAQQDRLAELAAKEAELVKVTQEREQARQQTSCQTPARPAESHALG